jgi:hypothetical protein
MNNLKFIVLVLLLFSTASLLAGCGKSGPKTFAVSGTIRYGTDVVPAGMVMFIPEGAGQRVSATIGTDGAYQLHAPEGIYKVVVNAPREAPQKEISKDNWTEAFGSVPERYVPLVYADPETTSLVTQVEAVDVNNIDIEIPVVGHRLGRR